MKTPYVRRLTAALVAGMLTAWLAHPGYGQTGSSTYTQKDKPLVQPGVNSAESHTPDPDRANSGSNGAAEGASASQNGAKKMSGTHPASGSTGQ